MIVHLKDENFKELVKEGKVLVDFYATWCGPCQMLAPVLEDFAKEHEEVKVIKVDVDQHEDLAQEFGILSVPTMQVYSEGVLVKTQSGFLPKEFIESWFQEI